MACTRTSPISFASLGKSTYILLFFLSLGVASNKANNKLHLALSTKVLGIIYAV